ncbi:MAG: hypothetical protein U0805_16990 [Pirellulales bacterium]
MIEQALRRFCELKHRKLIVIAGTFIVGLVLVMPLVDAIRAGRDEQESLLAELDSARSVAAEIQGFETRVGEKLTQLKEIEDRTVDDESMPALRGKLVDLAKETGCSIRRLNVGTMSSRAWKPGDSPLIATSDKKAAEPASGPNFQLEWRPVSISLSGTSASLRSMVERVAATGMLMHTKSLEMYPSSPTRQTLTLDMELWYFTLARKG